MSSLLIYLVKANLIVSAFYLLYHILFRRFTFFSLNRIYFLFAIFLGTVIPALHLNFNPGKETLLNRNWVVAFNETSKIHLSASSLNFQTFLEVLYFTGLIFMVLRFAIRLTSLYRISQDAVIKEVNGHQVKVVRSNTAPFSFWKNIYLNPDNYKKEFLKNIYTHEKVHTDQLHTIDVLLSELFLCCSWPNPFAWFIKLSIKENLEFIADNKAIGTGINVINYQYTLLKLNQATESFSFVTSFYNPPIKKRISMINKKKSSNAALAGYLFCIPVIAVVALFSCSQKDKIDTKDSRKLTNVKLSKASTFQTVADSVPGNSKVQIKSVHISGKFTPPIVYYVNGQIKSAEFVDKIDNATINSINIIKHTNDNPNDIIDVKLKQK